MIFLDNKLCFIHIPKTAGTFLRDFFKTKLSMILECWNCMNGYDYAHLPMSKLHMVFSESFLQGYKYFTVIRNPYDRFISAFFYMQREGYAIVKNRNINQFIQHDLQNISMNFDTFNKEFIHIIPQYKFICNDAGNIDERVFIIPYHKLNEGLFKLFHMTVPFRYKGYAVKQILSPESIRIIDEIYAKDLEMYGMMGKN